MRLSEAAARLLEILDPDGVLIGGICGALYGVERFTRDVDIAAALAPEEIVRRLREAGITADVRRSSEPDDLGWVVRGQLEGIAFQILPAAETGVDCAACEVKAGLRIAGIRDFIAGKCMAAGQQDMHDVAALCLVYPELEDFCRETAAANGCLKKLESWLSDRRLRQRYTPQTE